MSGKNMSDDQIWYGYLEAGEKSTPVLLDRGLNTGNPKTMYLFNMARKEILEYNRSIVEPKLMELKSEENGFSNELKQAFAEVMRNFTPRGDRIMNVPERGRPSAQKVKEEDTEKFDLVGAGSDLEIEEDWTDEDE